MNITTAINEIEKDLKTGKDLPENIFYFLSRHTPTINVDLLIKNERGEKLLTWRSDRFFKDGWHIPGGIIRYRETWKERILKTSFSELGVHVNLPNPLIPIEINEIFIKNKTRGHAISLLFACFLNSDSKIKNGKWFKKCPSNLVKIQNMYRKKLDE